MNIIKTVKLRMLGYIDHPACCILLNLFESDLFALEYSPVQKNELTVLLQRHNMYNKAHCTFSTLRHLVYSHA